MRSSRCHNFGTLPIRTGGRRNRDLVIHTRCAGIIQMSSSCHCSFAKLLVSADASAFAKSKIPWNCCHTQKFDCVFAFLSALSPVDWNLLCIKHTSCSPMSEWVIPQKQQGDGCIRQNGRYWFGESVSSGLILVSKSFKYAKQGNSQTKLNSVYGESIVL